MDSVDVNNKCRACLTMDPLQLFDWNVDMLENLTYMNCFRQCTQLEEFVDEPTMLCHSCASELKFVYEFIQKTTESDGALRLKQELIDTKEKSALYEPELEWATMTDEKNLSSPYRTSYESNDDADNLLDQNAVLTADSSNSPLDKTNQSIVKSKKRQGKEVLAKVTKRPLRSSGRSSRRETSDKRSDQIDIMEQDIGSTCSETFPKKQPKRKHKFLCHICSHIFRDSATLNRHTLTHKENRDRNYTCDHCGRKFLTQNSCQNHAKTHNSNRQPKFQCDQCEKAFFYMGGLNVHKKQHTGNMLECQICEKRYFRSIDLEIHLRSHSGFTPHECPHCDKSFAKVSVLNKHIRTHEGKRYKCDFCEKEYSSPSTLSNHRLQHTGLPLKCGLCGKGFGKKYKMRVHIGGVHKVKDIDEMDKLIIEVQTKGK